MNNLYILPFDHRVSFTKLIGAEAGNLSAKQIEQVKFLKNVIYSGFVLSLTMGLPNDEAAILVDEEFGQDIIKTAKENHHLVCQCVEKSGQKEFDFEHGEEFAKYIENNRPDIVKALVRYNPADDQALNARQLKKLSTLAAWCRAHNYKFMLEVLVPATANQLLAVGNSQETYDETMRPSLMQQMIIEMSDGGVVPDVWKVEGLTQTEHYQNLMNLITQSNPDSKLIILGRKAEVAVVKQWLKAGASVKGVIGFAVGRTVFEESLEKVVANDITAAQAAQEIAERFYEFYKYFISFKA